MQDFKKPRTAEYGEHYHKYYLFKTQNSFEPYTPDIGDETASGTYPNLYEMVEYAIMFCNCGDVIKTKVKNGSDQ